MEFQKQTTLLQEFTTESNFLSLVQSLRNEVQASRELTEKVLYYSNTLKRIERKEEPCPSEKVNEPYGVIETIFDEVFKLGAVNQELRVAVNHLEQIIGS